MADADELCLDDEIMASFLEGGLSASDRSQAERHMASCEGCRQQLTDLARLEADESQSYRSMVRDDKGTGHAPPSTSERGKHLAPGSTLGRYVVLGKVGAGGMGVVYSAYDPELDRRIAVKVIRTELFRETEEAQSQLRQEARAMARLTHPNVVRVYDVGRQGPLVYIAMEYVDGEDLHRFALRHRESGAWRPLLEACLQAGRGLQAAHDAGLVHRDFKPSNVLCAKDGRVLVADFGLTRLLPRSVDDGEGGYTTAVGTPGYAAPEQVAGKASDAKSDQYSYCVALSECLLGRDPTSPFRSHVDDKGEAPGAPKRLGAVLRRGLARDPEERYSSMQALLSCLQSTAHRRRRHALIGGSLAAAAGIGALMFSLGARVSSPTVKCASGSARLAQVWNETRSSSLKSQLAQTVYQRQTRHFVASIDELSRGLFREHKSACEATFESADQSASLFDRQMFCLNGQATELAAVIDMVERGGSVEAAQSALRTLGAAQDCRVSENMLSTRPPPTDARAQAQIQEVEDKLAQRLVLVQAGEKARALQQTTAAVEEAKAIGYGPLLARAQLSHAKALEGMDRYAAAREAAERARDAASEGHDTSRMIRALLVIAELTSSKLDEIEEGAAFLDTARSLSLGSDLPAYDLANIDRVSAVIARHRKDSAEAVEHAETGLARLAGENEESPAVMEIEISLRGIIAAAQFDANQIDEAADTLQLIFDLKEKRLGPEHSGLARTLTNLATAQYKLSKLEAAAASLARARALLESPDASRSELARCVHLEALVQDRLGKGEAALALHRQALSLREEIFGPNHRSVWSTKNNLANALVALEHWAEAQEIQREYIAWAVERTGENSSDALTGRVNLANTLVRGHLQDSDLEGAQVLLTQVLEALPDGDPRRVNARTVQGEALFLLERYDRSAARFGEALALAESTPHTRESLEAHIAARQAEALWKAGQHARSLALASRAQLIYRELPEKAEALAELEQWIAEREGESR